MFRIISNTDRCNHRQLLQGWLAGSVDAFVAVAFLKHSGLKGIEAELESFLQRGGSLRLMVGTDFFLTEAQALRDLERLAKQYPKLEWRMVDQAATSTFHPKYYRFRDATSIWMMTGSANLTGGGLERNVELSMIVEDVVNGPTALEAVKAEAALWSNPRARVPSEVLLGRYAAQSELARKRMEAAQAEVLREFEQSPRLEGQQLVSELAAYRTDAEQQADRAQRKSNYREALRLLHSDLLSMPEPTEPEFEAIYQRLVGQRGGDKLWHSGSVYRSKAMVLPNWKIVVAMIRDIAANLKRSPEEMYQHGGEWMAQIEGLGPNIFTEFCHTFAPTQYAPLNNNPVTSLRWLQVDQFPNPSSFKSDDYGRFCRCLERLQNQCGFADLGETDHFLNFVYWRHKHEAK